MCQSYGAIEVVFTKTPCTLHLTMKYALLQSLSPDLHQADKLQFIKFSTEAASADRFLSSFN